MEEITKIHRKELLKIVAMARGLIAIIKLHQQKEVSNELLIRYSNSMETDLNNIINNKKNEQ